MIQCHCCNDAPLEHRFVQTALSCVDRLSVCADRLAGTSLQGSDSSSLRLPLTAASPAQHPQQAPDDDECTLSDDGPVA